MKRTGFAKKATKSLRRTKLKKVSKATPAKLKAKLDRVFSLYIRQKYADKNGLVACYTCGVKKPIKEMQCGHFEKRHNLCTRWEERNCRVQCPGCNVFRDGNYPEFAHRLNEEEPGILRELNHLKNMVCKFAPADYERLIEYYQSLIK